MKECERLLKKNVVAHYQVNKSPLVCQEISYRNGFRAALEWLRDNEDAHCCGDCDQVGEWSPCPKDTAIKNELEN